ncbi:MAG: 50S ribosomal protein L3 [bacterium]|nr:50S ribosomal protein L3 [bacterium]
MKFLLGKKLRMSQIFDEKGDVVPVTLVEAGPCYVTQVKTKEKDGYDAMQIKYKNKRRESPAWGGNVGDIIDVSIFHEGDKVKISGISKGKGFAGVVKKWGFKGRQSVSHGTKHELRTPGSTGSSQPDRVRKGKKLAGRMGADRVTVKNLKIAKVDKEKNMLFVRGAIPGHPGTFLEIRG